MLRHLFRSKKMKRKEANAAAVLPLYGRAADVMPAEYLARNQVEPERVAKIQAAAQERRNRRNAKRLGHAQATAAKAG